MIDGEGNIVTIHMPLRKTRIIAPKKAQGLGQILKKEDIKVGKCYWVYNTKFKTRETIRVKSKPYYRSGSPWIKVLDLSNKEEDVMSLMDMGIEPYDSGLWNPAHYTVLDP